jgi:uncharacterized protein YdeI (YjbR/CyaY-like superfamily)
MPIRPPGPEDVRIFPSPADFDAWLDENHDTATELWVGYYKKHVPKQAMTYVQAVEEALCFGWIDGITYRIDDEVTATRFTPRRRGSGWSAPNLKRVAKLTAAGRMRPSGLRAFEARDPAKDVPTTAERGAAELPPEAEPRLRANPAAWAYWQGQRPSYRRGATAWIMDAKRPETRERRLDTLIEDSAAGRMIKPMRVERDRDGSGAR